MAFGYDQPVALFPLGVFRVYLHDFTIQRRHQIGHGHRAADMAAVERVHRAQGSFADLSGEDVHFFETFFHFALTSLSLLLIYRLIDLNHIFNGERYIVVIQQTGLASHDALCKALEFRIRNAEFLQRLARLNLVE